MRSVAKIFTAAVVALIASTSAWGASPNIVLSQVYAGGGSSAAGTAYTKDYVELFNTSSSPVGLTGHSLQYGAATGNLGASAGQIFAFPAGTTIPAGGYLLVALGSPGTAGAAVPSPDFSTTNLSMGAASGKVALANIATGLGCGTTPCTLPHANIIDLVGWGTSNTAEGGAPITSATLNSTNGSIRNSLGCTDTDNNNADFTVVTVGTGLVPRNSASATHSCAPNNAPTITPPSDPITTVAQDAAPFPVNLTGSDDGGVYNWSATTGTGVASAVVTGGQGTANVTYTVTLVGGFSGTATFTASLSDGVNTAATQAVNITVTPAPPAAPTGLTAVAGTAHVQTNWNNVSGATSYNVKRATVSGGPYTTIASPAANSHDDTTAVDGTQYFYVVSAVGPGGEGPDSTEVTATPMAAPTGVAATPGNNQVGLAWNAVTGATSYNVKRATVTGGPYTTIINVGTNAHTDSTAVNGTQYFYVVSAVNATGESIDSAEVSATPAPPGKIVLSQVYAGGGSSAAGTAYTKDYVELFNSGGLPVVLTGHSLQYGAATGNLGASAGQIFAFPAGTTIPAGRYLLVALGSPGTAGAAVPSPDFSTTNLSMGAASGKVALANIATGLGCGTTPCTLPHANILDLVGWGTSNTAEGGAPITSATLNSTNGSIRKLAGCTDTDNNNADFVVATTGTGLVPRNSSTPQNICGANLPPAITPPADPITTVTMDAPPFPVGLTGNDDGGIFNWSATPGTGVFSVTVSGGQGTPNVTYTVTLVAGYTGTATFTATLSDGVNPPVNQAVNIQVDLPPPPGAPTGLAATPGDSHVDLAWNSVPGATSFNVKRATVSGGPYSTIASPATNSYDDTTAVNGTTYYYVVSAVGAGGEGPDSTEVSATPAATPTVPPAPTNLIATPGNNTVALTWDTTATATSYNVKRGTAPGGPYTPIATGVVPTNYDDNTAVNGTTYYYVVSASNAQGEGSDSNEASATPTPALAAPANLLAAVGDARVILNWDPVGGAATYNVKRGTTPGGPYSTVGSPATNTFTDTTVVNGTQYFYVVTAVGPESLNSNEVPATPNTPAALGLVISQVYGGGGNTSAQFQNDFIEVFNRSNQAIAVTGWSVQYASSTGTTWTPTNLNGVIPPGRYYLVAEGAGTSCSGSPCGDPLPASDASGAIGMSGTNGKVALAGSTTALTGACPTGPTIADFVGYGSANCSETAATPALSNTTAAMRDNNGCDDTNHNANDFAIVAPAPRNSTTPQNSCGFLATGAANPPAVDPGQNTTLTVTVTPAIAPPSTGITVAVDLSSIGGSASQTFFDDGATGGDQNPGDNIFTYTATVSIGTAAGNKSLLALVTDAQARGTSTAIALTVNPPLETIAAVKIDNDANTIPDRVGQSVRIEGVVTSIDFRGSNGVEYYVQDATGGIVAFHTSTNFGPFSVGQSVGVIGSLTQFNGLTEIVPASMTLVAPLPGVTPNTVTLSAINESLEGTLVRVDNLTMAPGPLAGDTNYTINDGTNGTMRIDADTDIPGNNAPTTTFSLIGVIGQFDNTNPFDSGYQILPRSNADIIPLTSPTGVGAANPPSVPPGATTLLTVNVTPGQNPPSTGITVVVDLSSIGLSATQAFFDDGSNGDVAPLDSIYSYSATVDGGTALGPKSLPVTITDAETRSSATSIPLNIQSASAPPPPANLSATPGNATVDLDWDPSLGATGYNVKRSTVSGGPYTTIASDIAADSYTDNSVTNGVTYYYVVSALSGANESGDSAPVSATPTAPPPAGPLAKIYFVDIGQGAGTLIVGPTGTSMLIDAGPTGQGNAKVLPLLNAVLPPGDKVDYTIVTHYHVDHDAGMTEVINAGMLDGGIAYDNGDAPHVVPPVPTNSTGTAFTAYKNAITSRSGAVTRTTITPGLVINLGGGMTATCLVTGGDFASGGSVYVSGTDLNSSSIATLIQYEDFDYLVSGDLTGGGSTTTAKTPDVETFVAQMAGDVDVVQLDHHGSTTANNRRFLSMLKAEMSFASIGTSNTFGHPNREVVNRYLNTPATSGNTYPGEGVPSPGNGPVHYQTEASPPTDNRTTVQFHSGASAGNAGQGTILLETDGDISFTLESFDDGGVRINPAQHVYAIDGQGLGVATDFPPTVIPFMSPGVPTAADAVTLTALVNDVQPITSVTLNYSLNGAAQAPVMMTPTGSEFSAVIPAQANATRVDFTITAVANGLTTTYTSGYFSGTTPVANLRSITALGEPTYLDYAARISGLALSTTGDYSTSNNDDYLDDATGALNLSRTIEPDVPATQPVSVGNTYAVAGVISQLTGRLRLDVTPPFDGITKPWDTTAGSYNPYGITLTGSATVTPQTKTIAQILAAPENHEAHLVSIANVTITSGTIPASGGLDAFLTINDGTGTMEMKIDSDGDIPGLATPAGSFTLVGIVQQDDFLRPFSTRYTIAPRNRTDLGAAAGGPALITIAEAREDIDPTTFTSPDDFVPDRLGQQVKVRGVVTSTDFRAGGNGIEYYIQDPTAGIVVFDATVNLALNIGDSVEVVGTITQFNGLTEIDITNISDITTLAPGTMPPVSVEVVTLSQLADAGVGEIYEGKFIRINNVTLTSPPATFAANTNYNITDASGGPVQMRIDADTNIDGTAPPSSPFSVIGVLGQFDSTDPRDSGYQFFPRMLTDFLPSTPAAASITATAGTPQSATVSTAFATQLQATVLDGSNNPIEGIGVTFTAPGAGASGTFANSTTTTNATTSASGIATASVFTANGIAGSYNVVASTASLTANFALTNTDPAATHFDVVAPANVTNGIAFNVTVTARDASNNVATGYTGTVQFSSSSSGTLPPNYTFTVGDAGVHTFSVTLTTNGTQSITVTDTVDSQITGTTNTTVNNCDLPTTPTITGTPNGTNSNTQACPTNTLTLTANSTGATSYQWYDGVTPLGGETSSTYLATGAGNFSVTATNACGTTAQSAGYAVTNPTPSPATISANNTVICAGGTVVLSSTAAGVQWYRDNVAIPGATNPTYGATLAGTYHAVRAINFCPSASSNQIVLTSSASPAPNADITAPSSVLGGSTGNVASVADAGAGATYAWAIGGPGNITSGQGTNSITFSPNGNSGTMTILVTVTLPGGCTDSKSKDVLITSGTGVPTHFSVTAPANVDAGTPFNVTVTALDNFNNVAPSYTGTVHFTSSSAGTLPGDYTFTAGDNGAHTFSVTLTTNGTQSITVTDTASASITGTTNTNVSCPAVPAPAITPQGPTSFCPGGSVVLQSSIATGLQWYRDGNPVGAGEQNFTATLAGSYTATVTSNGCVSPASNAVVVTVNPVPDATITAPSTVVPGSTGNAASVANAGAGATYAWSITNGTITAGAGTANITFTAGAAGTLTLGITVTNSSGCTDSDFVNVGVGCPPPPPQPAPVIDGSDSVCASSTNNTASFNYGGTVTWTITNGIIISGQGTSTITYAAGSSGSVGLTAHSTTGGACPIVGHAVKSVTIRPLPSAILSESVHVCAGTSVTVYATLTGTAPFTVVWSDGVIQSGLPTAEATRTFVATTTTTFMIDSVTDAFCTNTERANAMTVFVDPPPVITTQPAHKVIPNGTSATLTVGTPAPGVTYQWYQGSVGDTSTPVGTNSASFTTPALTNTTRYWVRVSNACGSVDSQLAVVTVTGKKTRGVRH